MDSAAFADRLRRRPGHARATPIFAPEPDGPASTRPGSRSRSRIADRIERQTYRLERATVRPGSSPTSRPPATGSPRTALGSLATYEEPEGVPVAAMLLKIRAKRPRRNLEGNREAPIAMSCPVSHGSEEIIMRIRLIVVVLTCWASCRFPRPAAQRPPTEPSPAPLDPDTVAVRLILGIGDAEPQDWSGRVTLDKGEIVDVEGVRFRDGDGSRAAALEGQSRLIRKDGARRSSCAKAKAVASSAVAEVDGGPSTTGRRFAPNGVVVALKNVGRRDADGRDRPGTFAVPLDRLADGSAVSLLDGRVRAQRVFPHAPLCRKARPARLPRRGRRAPRVGAWVATSGTSRAGRSCSRP